MGDFLKGNEENVEFYGILTLLSSNQKDSADDNLMESESILNFLFDLLDNLKSPQADAFNTLFNCLEIFHAFKMRLP